ncbi:MAG: pyridoxamine 5'-phosphate oxidase [Cenarchaeum symbiont of Oopsacas minuta]|nr:pyridoxamine 5'-phosphate oxidase [Cenarchaeum symbiont of Oopsacas minuta]
MKLGGKLEIKSPQKIAKFLHEEHTGRIASIDDNGFPQIIPMNFVYIDSCVYMHSHIRGEKLDNIARNSKVGFEVDRELEFLPSYFEDPKDASFADTLYVSVIIKGNASVVTDLKEMTRALNGLMEKYQPEGRYEKILDTDDVLSYVTVIKVIPKQIRGKYKVGQNIKIGKRKELAKKIFERNSHAIKTLEIMGFDIKNNTPIMTSEPNW